VKWHYTIGLLLGILACGTLGHAQTVVAYNTVAFGNGGRGINNPTVTVCAHVQPPANPCTGTLTTLYSNSALSAQTNPFLGDTFGNVNFWSAPGTYDISIAAPLLPTYTYSVTLGGSGIPGTVSVNLTAQTGNINPTTLYAVPIGAGGMYRVSCYIVTTQAATVSSTLPSCVITWTDADTSVSPSFPITATSTQNIVGVVGPNVINNGGVITSSPFPINVKGGTNIQYNTSNYASSGATPMQFAIHIRLENLGP
jgi:hypothetical protein